MDAREKEVGALREERRPDERAAAANGSVDRPSDTPLREDLREWGIHQIGQVFDELAATHPATAPDTRSEATGEDEDGRRE